MAQVAREFGVSWATVMAAVVDYGTPLVDDPHRLDGVTVLGVDETAFLRANAIRHTTFVTGVVDVRSRRLLDVTHGRSETVLSQWISGQGPAWRHTVEWRRWSRSAATPPPCPRPCRTRCGSWTAST